MRKIKKILFLILVNLCLIGCTKKLDINELTLVSAIGIDKAENGFKLVAQVVNKNILIPNPPQITPVIIIESEGETVFDCLLNLEDILPSRPFLINLQLLVFSEEIAREGIGKYTHFFVNYNEAQHEYNVIITKDVTVKEFLEQISVFSVFPTRVFIDKVKSATENFGIAKETYIEEVVNVLQNETENLVLTSVTVMGDLENGRNVDQNKDTNIASEILISDMGVFEGDKLVYWLNKEESIAYNIVRNNIVNTIVTVEGLENNKVSFYVEKIKSNIKVELQNELPKVKVEVKMNVSITEDSAKNIRSDKEHEEHLRGNIEKKIKKQIDDLVKKVKKSLI